MNEQEALRLEMLDQRIELIFEEMERNHPEFSQEEAELSRIRDEIEQDPLLGHVGKRKCRSTSVSSPAWSKGTISTFIARAPKTVSGC